MALLPRKTKIKTGIVNLLTAVIPFSLLRSGLPGRFIVYGHVLGKKGHFVSEKYRYPTIEEFDAFVKKFRALGYTFVSLDEYLVDDGMKKILVTFDDGFKVIYDEAHPYLTSQKIPYSIFVITDALKDPNYFIPTIEASRPGRERKFLSFDEIEKLKRSGVHVGFHTTDHTLVEDKHFGTDTMRRVLTVPDIYRQLFSEPLTFAYPYYAPASFRKFNNWMKETMKFKLFFDTEGFMTNDNDHYFRVSIDGERDLKQKNWLDFVIRRQLLLFVLNKRKKR
jgi:peptidoglycan/xylan/chitin deacetylase (PgdA/CDA1 family)